MKHKIKSVVYFYVRIRKDSVRKIRISSGEKDQHWFHWKNLGSYSLRDGKINSDLLRDSKVSSDPLERSGSTLLKKTRIKSIERYQD